MTDKDLLSINEAYAASQKAVKEPVNESPLTTLGKVAAPIAVNAINKLVTKKLKKDEEEASEEVK